MDKRKDLLIFAQRIFMLQQSIADLAKEDAKLTSLYESATLKTRGAYHQSFRVVTLTLKEAGSWLGQNRAGFKNVYISTMYPSRWVLANLEESPVPEKECDEDDCVLEE